MANRAERKSLSKKVRFEVFKRDSFTCCYCGSTPPKVVLEVDHIDPVANGGSNDMENLITACFDCNRGKSKQLLSSVAPPISSHFEQVSEKELQIKAHKKLLTQVKRRKTIEENKIAKIFSKFFPDKELTHKFKKGSIRGFLDKLPITSVEEAMEIASVKIDNPDNAVKYFCGICWNMVRDSE